jgi:AraC-like DNA-binding protein
MPMLPGMDIPPEMEAAIEARQDTLGVYSGVRLFERQPRLYALVARMLARAYSDREIAEVVGVSSKLVAAVRRREVDSMPTKAYNRAQARNARLAAMMVIDEVRRRLDDPDEVARMSGRDLAQLAQVSQNIAQLLAGEPTERILSVQAEGASSGLRALLSGRVIEGEASAIHSRGNSEPSREGGGAAVDAVPGGADAGGLGAGSGEAEAMPADGREGGDSDAQSPAYGA